jgi:hypothetical protein
VSDLPALYRAGKHNTGEPGWLSEHDAAQPVGLCVARLDGPQPQNLLIAAPPDCEGSGMIDAWSD